MCHSTWLAQHRLRSFARNPIRIALAISTASGCFTYQCEEGWAQSDRDEVIPPTVLTHVDAEYPSSSLAKHEHADVVVAATVDVDGHVSKTEVLQSGGADLDEAAIVAVRQWTFVPAKRRGIPIASRIRVPFHFAPPAPPPELVSPPPSAETTLPPKMAVQQVPEAHRVSPTSGKSAQDVSDTEVTVTGRLAAPNRGASDFNIPVGELRNVPRQNATEYLKLAPGILLTNEGGEGHAEQVFLRGFDAREGQDVEFSVDGVPINESGNLHGNGYADTHFIIPELIGSLRVVEGPFDPRQGNYAVAGSANYELGLERRGLSAKYTVGSWNTQRLLLLWGPSGESTHTFGGAEVFSTQGYGQNRDAQRATAMGQYEGKLGANGSYRITGTAYATHYHSAGVIRQDDYDTGRIGFYDSYAILLHQAVKPGGDASRYSIAADVETRKGNTTYSQQVFVIGRDMRLLEDFTGYLLDVQLPLQSLHTQRGDMIDLHVHELTLGARGASRLSGTALGFEQQLEVGYFARGDVVTGTQQRIAAATGYPYMTDTDLTSNLGDMGLYADANLKLLPWLRLQGGLREDLFAFQVNNLCAVQSVAHPSPSTPLDQSCLSQADRGLAREPNQPASTSSIATLPRASVIVGPLGHFSYSLSYGKGVRTVDPSYVTQDVKTPFASVVAYEGGVTYANTIAGMSLVGRSIFFQTHVDKDLIFNETVGRNVLGVGTTRTGWVGALRLTGTHFDESANLTLVRSTYDDTHLLVAYVPDAVLRSDSVYISELPFSMNRHPVNAMVGAGITYVGPRALPFGQRSDSIFTTDVTGALTWTNFELGFSITNLFGARYRLGEYNYASNWYPPGSGQQPSLVPERQFTAGPPRGIFGHFAINFQGT
jgi:TonB family protein